MVYNDHVCPNKVEPEKVPEFRFPSSLTRNRLAKPRKTFLAFDSSGVPAYATTNIIVQPQVIFKPKRLVVPPEFGAFFKLISLRVGVLEQFAGSSGGVSMSVFPPIPPDGEPIDNLDGIDCVQIGQCLCLTITNVDTAHHDFNAIVYGETI